MECKSCCLDSLKPDRTLTVVQTEPDVLHLHLHPDFKVKVLVVWAWNDDCGPDAGTATLIDTSLPPTRRVPGPLRAKYARHIVKESTCHEWYEHKMYSCLCPTFYFNPPVTFWNTQQYLLFQYGSNTIEKLEQATLRLFGTYSGAERLPAGVHTREEIWHVDISVGKQATQSLAGSMESLAPPPSR